MKDYDFELAYHLGKANVVADALSRRSHVASLLVSREWRLMADMADAVYRVLRQQGGSFCDWFVSNVESVHPSHCSSAG